MYPFDPSDGYKIYWQFAAERQAIFFRRLSGDVAPWTRDPILQKHKFTNVYRATDRVSQYLIKNVIYGSRLSTAVNETFFRVILFKLFNKIETWQLIVQNDGMPTVSKFNIRRYDELLSDAMARGNKIFSAAYIMPSGINDPGHPKKHQNCLALLERMLDDDLPARINKSSSMREVFYLFLKYPMIGKFLAYQFAVDINYSEITDFSENEFVMPGPGAMRGIAKCIRHQRGMSEAQIIKWMVDHQEEEFEKAGIAFESLWGRRLHLIDCQNLFCEVDKYLRVRMPHLGERKESRIKQLFKPISNPIQFTFPPKWGLSTRT